MADTEHAVVAVRIKAGPFSEVIIFLKTAAYSLDAVREHYVKANDHRYTPNLEWQLSEVETWESCEQYDRFVARGDVWRAKAFRHELWIAGPCELVVP